MRLYYSKKYIKSPINYSGGKFRLLNQIIPLFPRKLNTFIDLFCGACTVGVNVNANKIIFNDFIHYIPELFNLWKNKPLNEINNYIDITIDKWNLSGKNKQAFLEFREHYNRTKHIEDLFILVCYSFNYQMRFNNSHEFNCSFGYEASTMNDNIRNNINLFVNFIQNKNTEFLSKDFRKVNLQFLGEDDFVYCDPPYLISNAVYQDGKRGFKGWGESDDLDLYDLLDNLNSNGVKFALSNMFSSKGQSNEALIEWSKKYYVNYLNANYNTNYQRISKGYADQEVLVTNYRTGEALAKQVSFL